MRHSKESTEEYIKALEEYYKSSKGYIKKDKELEPFLRKDIVTSIIMCLLLNKESLISDLGKVLLQIVTHNYWDLVTSLDEINYKIMEGPFYKKQLISQKTKEDILKEKIVQAMQICHKNLPNDSDLLCRLAILMCKVDYSGYNYGKIGLKKIQNKYLARLNKKKVA